MIDTDVLFFLQHDRQARKTAAAKVEQIDLRPACTRGHKT